MYKSVDSIPMQGAKARPRILSDNPIHEVSSASGTHQGVFNSSIVVERKLSPVDLDKTLSDESDEDRYHSDASSEHSSSED